MLHLGRLILPPVEFDSDLATKGLGGFASITNSHLMTVMDDPILGASRKVVRMVVPDDAGWPTENPRGQLQSTYALVEGTDFWLGFGVLLPAGTGHPTSPGGYLAFMQLYGPPFAGYPPVRIAFEGSEGRFGWRRGDTLGWEWACEMTPQYDAWMDFACRIKVSADPEVGFVEVWTNFGSGWAPQAMQPAGGTVEGHRLYTQTITPAVSNGRLRTDIQSYRKVGQIESVTSYHADMRRAVATGNDSTDIASVSPGSYD